MYSIPQQLNNQLRQSNKKSQLKLESRTSENIKDAKHFKPTEVFVQ